MYQSTLHHDQLLRARVDVEECPENWQAMRDLKETWKARFVRGVKLCFLFFSLTACVWEARLRPIIGR